MALTASGLSPALPWGREWPSRTILYPAARLSLCEPKNGAGRNERTTTQTTPFQANPLGRGQLADFLSGGGPISSMF